MPLFKKGIEAQEARLAWFLISPTALIVFGLIIFPAVFSIWVSFHSVTLGNLDDVFHAESAVDRAPTHSRKVNTNKNISRKQGRALGQQTPVVANGFLAQWQENLKTLVVELLHGDILAGGLRCNNVPAPV